MKIRSRKSPASEILISESQKKDDGDNEDDDDSNKEVEGLWFSFIIVKGGCELNSRPVNLLGYVGKQQQFQSTASGNLPGLLLTYRTNLNHWHNPLWGKLQFTGPLTIKGGSRAIPPKNRPPSFSSPLQADVLGGGVALDPPLTSTTFVDPLKQKIPISSGPL